MNNTTEPISENSKKENITKATSETTKKEKKVKTKKITKILAGIISLLVVICIITFFLMNQGFKIGNQNNLGNSNNQQTVCKEHKDINKDRSCDICLEELSDMYYVESKTLETKINNKKITLKGNMPKDSSLKVKEVNKEEYTEKAKEYFKEDFIGLDYAYDIKILENGGVYNPSEYNQVIDIQFEGMKVGTQKNYAVLHIKDEENMEVLNLDSNKEGVSFKTTSFSVFLVIQVAGKNVSFDGEHVTIYDLDMNEITEATTVASGTNFQFIAIADEGYGISTATQTNVKSTGSLRMRTYTVSSITADMTINIVTTTAPVITVQPKSVKTKQKVIPTLEITAENATSYEWQLRRDPNGYWESAQGSGTNSRTFKPKVDNLGVYEYRCLVGNAAYTTDERTVSDTIMVVVASDFNVTYDRPIILDQEIVKQKVKMGEESAQYVVTAQGTNLTFKWQYRTKVDNWWQDVTNSIATSKNTQVSTAENGEKIMTSTLTTVASQKILQFAEFRCIVGNDNYKSDNGAYSDNFLYLATADDVETKMAYHNIQITKQPTSKKVMIGDIATFSIETEAANTYKWQYKTNYDEKLWTDVDSKMGLAVDVASGFKTAELKIDTSAMKVNVVDGNIEVENNLSGYVFRCVTSSSAVINATKESDTVLLLVTQDETVKENIVLLEKPILEVPEDVLVSLGKTKDIEVGYNGDGELSSSSSDENIVVATTTQRKLSLRGMGVGTATVTLSSSVGTNYGATQTEIDVEVLDDGNVLITEWSVPVNVDKTNGTTGTNASGDTITLGPQTTIKLPIPKHANNNYTVIWGDGSAVETFDSTADFPTHTYKNTEVTLYEIRIAGTVHTFGHTSTTQPTTSNVQKDYYTFARYLKSIVSWGELNAVRYGFSYCTALNKIAEPTDNTFANVTDMSYLFYQCTGYRASIPENLFKGAKNVTNFSNVFSGCSYITGNIPENLFKDAIKATNLSYAFYNCYGLRESIPGNLFATTTEVTNMQGVFENCYNIKGPIPANLFANTTNVGTFNTTFNGCRGLSGQIPEELFANTKKVGTFTYTFTNCSGLTGSIPENLFANNTEVGEFFNTFYGCSGLTGSIPANLFANNKKVKSFSHTFVYCSGLTGPLPSELFANTPEVTDFQNCFSGCSNIKGPIPADFFKYTTKVNSFVGTFRGCGGLTGIPEGLFDTNTEVTSFGHTFKWCTGLTNIPENLFAQSTKAKDFAHTFYNCTGLNGSIPENLFANNLQATSFNSTFAYCSGLTGSIPENLFANNLQATDFTSTFVYCSELSGGVTNNLFVPNVTNLDSTFEGCSNLTSLEIDTNLIGNKMFYGCNKLTNIKIGNNVQTIGTDAFEATEPYNSKNLLKTALTSDNEISSTYNWVLDNRCADEFIDVQPEDIMAKEYEEVTFNIEASGDNLQYQWYEIEAEDGTSGDAVSGDTISGDLISTNIKKLTEENTKIFKSNIKGQANTTATSVIKIKETNPCNVSFDYKVSSEAGGDLFSVTIEDANGITKAVDGISGEVEWTSYSKECTPTAEGEIIITLTYAKNATIDVGGDFGAIRNLKYDATKSKYFTFEEDDNFVVDPQFAIINPYYSYNDPFVAKEEDENIIFENENYTQAYYYNSAMFGIYLDAETTFSFDMRINGEYSDHYVYMYIEDGNGYKTVYDGYEPTNEWVTYTTTVIPDNAGMMIFYIESCPNKTLDDPNKTFAIRNVAVITGLKNSCTYKTDEFFTVENTNSQFESTSYNGTNTPVLTIPAEQVTTEIDENKYYCEVSNNMGVEKSRQALLTIEGIEDEGDDYENIDLEKSLITEWTIPVDLNGAGNGTTIKLPIPSHNNNYYVVDWGDGSNIERFADASSFPTHTYQNASETTYEVKVGGTVNQFGYTQTASISESNANQDYETFTNYLTGLIAWGEINATRYGFSRCTNLTGEIPVPELTAKTFKNVTDMSNLFYMCTGLNIEIPAELFATARNVTNFSNTFNGCENLTGMIPAKLFNYKSKLTTCEGMFEGCKGLTAGEIAIDKDEAINMDRMFKGCTGLESIVFGKYNKHLNGTAMFEGASSLRAVIILNQAMAQDQVGVAKDLATLGLRDEATIYVPYRTNEAIYEQAWSNIAADKIEEIVKANEPNPDFVTIYGTYVDETGYSVAGFGMNEKEKYTQYGFRVDIDGMPVDTSEIGSEWIVYTLIKEK